MTQQSDTERLKQIRERRARVENSDLDYATADTGTRCVGYIYEKGTGSKVAQMESLYDVMRGQFFANAAADIDFLLSLVDSQAADGDEAPFCAVHKSLDEQGKLELEVGNDCLACSLNERTELLDALIPLARPDGTQDAVTVLADAIKSAATAMRDACVEKVKEALADARRSWAASRATTEYELGGRAAFTWAISAIESITLDTFSLSSNAVAQTVDNEVVLVDREVAAKMAFDAVKAALVNEKNYSTLQVAANVAANVRKIPAATTPAPVEQEETKK